MTERDPFHKKFTRRKFLVNSAALAGVTLLSADQVLKDGIVVDKPALTPHLKRINLSYPAREMSADTTVDAQLVRRQVQLNDVSNVRFNDRHELIFQHENAKFDPEREYIFSHRSGNRRPLVDKAIKLGANGFDIDASDIGDGQIRAEHGIVRAIDFGFVNFGGVFDRDEWEFRTRLPRTVSNMIDYIGERSDPDDPYVVEIELKRGKFEHYDALSDMIGAISRNFLPTRVFSPNPDAVDNLYAAAVKFGTVENVA